MDLVVGCSVDNPKKLYSSVIQGRSGNSKPAHDPGIIW